MSLHPFWDTGVLGDWHGHMNITSVHHLLSTYIW